MCVCVLVAPVVVWVDCEVCVAVREKLVSWFGERTKRGVPAFFLSLKGKEVSVRGGRRQRVVGVVVLAVFVCTFVFFRHRRSFCLCLFFLSLFFVSASETRWNRCLCVFLSFCTSLKYVQRRQYTQSNKCLCSHKQTRATRLWTFGRDFGSLKYWFWLPFFRM